MGASASGGIGIGVGVLLGVLAIAFPPAGAGFFFYASALLAAGSMVAGGIMSLAFAPKAASQNNAAQNDFQIATSTEGFPVPVIFGRQRVNPNYMNYTKSNFTSTVLTQNAGKSDGGGTVVGHKYFLTWEMALCMGPIDEILQVISTPGEVSMRGVDAPTLTFGNEDFKEFSLSATNEGGLLRLYRGGLTQDRIATGDPYYSGFSNVVTDLFAQQATNTVVISQPILSGAYVGGTIIWADLTTSTITKVTDSNTCTVNGSAITRVNQAVTLNPPAFLQNTSTMNYRGICWSLFGVGSNRFAIGLLAQPKTYQFILGRLPAHDADFYMQRPDGTTITGFRVRGSGNTGHHCYTEANPAAIIYEILTNQRWGRGLPQDIFTAEAEASFILCSQFFYDHNIGMSFTLNTAEDLQTVIDSIRNHLKTVIILDGETIKLRCLLDITQTHGNIKTLNKSKATNIKFTRPDWSGTFNEIRAEFINVNKNYRPDVLHVQDLANIQLNGGQINSQRVQLSGFTDWNLTRQQTFRLLREVSYPLGVLSFDMNRYLSRLEPGDCFRFIFDEYSDNEVTGYWIVTKITKDKSDDETITVNAVEDILLGSIDGVETSTVVPTIYPWEKIADITPNQIGLFVPPSNTNGTVFPVRVFELPILITQGVAKLIVLGQRPSPNVTSMNLYWQNGTTWTQLGSQAQFAASGQLAGDWLTCLQTDRSGAGLRFNLTDPSDDEPTVLSANQVEEPTDNLETLLNSGADYIIIGDEIIQVGLIEKLGTNDYRARNLIRGRFGTDVVPHYQDEQVWFLKTMPTGITATTLGVAARALNFKVYPVGTAGETQTGDAFAIDGNGGLFVALGKQPVRPTVRSAVYQYNVNGPSALLGVRPAFFDKGCEAASFFYVMANPLTSVGTMTFHCLGGNATIGSSVESDFDLAVTNTYVADSLTDVTHGVINMQAGPQQPDFLGFLHYIFKVYAVYNGVKSSPFVITFKSHSGDAP
jgi:hypothetical protein